MTGTYSALHHTTYADDFDLTGSTNRTSLTIDVEAIDDTRFRSDLVARSRVAGLEDVQAGATVVFEAGSGTVDPQIFTNITGRKVMTMTEAATEAERAYFFQARDFSYTPGANVGELLTAEWMAQGTKGSGTLSAGAIAGYLGKAKGSVSATGALGTAKQLGAVGASQFLYASFHVFTAGTTITVVLESDDNSNFTSATTRATIGPLTTAGGTWASRVAGAITDDYYRFRVTAITGTFTVAGAFGIK